MVTTEKKLWPLWQRLLTTTALKVKLLKVNASLTQWEIIAGVNHNIPVLRDIITQPKFISGDITTSFIKDVYPNGFKGASMNNYFIKMGTLNRNNYHM